MSLTCYVAVTANSSSFGPEDLYMDGSKEPVDEISLEFSSSPVAGVTFIIACEVIHAHYEPGDPTTSNARGSTCKIENSTISTDKKFEIHVTPTSGTTEADWVFPIAPGLFQPKRLTIKVKRASGL